MRMTMSRAGLAGLLLLAVTGESAARTIPITVVMAIEVDGDDGRPRLVVRSNSSPCKDGDEVDEKCIFFAGGGAGDRALIRFELEEAGCGAGESGFRLFDGGFQLADRADSFGRPVAQRILRHFRGAGRSGEQDDTAEPNPWGYVPTRVARSGKRLWVWNRYQADEEPYEAWYRVFVSSRACSDEETVLELDPRMRNGGNMQPQ